MLPREVVLVDDGSDRPLEFEALQKLLPIPLLLERQSNAGLSCARNRAIELSQGAYILPLDSDDVLDSKAIETFLSAELDSDTVYFGNFQMFGESSELICGALDFDPRKIPHRNIIPYASLYSKALWESIGKYDETMREGYEDWEFWIRAYVQKKHFQPIACTILHYRVRAESMLAGSRRSHARLVLDFRKRYPEVYPPTRKFLEVVTGMDPGGLFVCHNGKFFFPLVSKNSTTFLKSLVYQLDYPGEPAPEDLHEFFGQTIPSQHRVSIDQGAVLEQMGYTGFCVKSDPIERLCSLYDNQINPQNKAIFEHFYFYHLDLQGAPLPVFLAWVLYETSKANVLHQDEHVRRQWISESILGVHTEVQISVLNAFLSELLPGISLPEKRNASKSIHTNFQKSELDLVEAIYEMDFLLGQVIAPPISDVVLCGEESHLSEDFRRRASYYGIKNFFLVSPTSNCFMTEAKKICPHSEGGLLLINQDVISVLSWKRMLQEIHECKDVELMMLSEAPNIALSVRGEVWNRSEVVELKNAWDNKALHAFPAFVPRESPLKTLQHYWESRGLR